MTNLKKLLKHEDLDLHNFTKCLKNQPCDVIQMREMRGEVGKKTHKKRDG